MHKNIYNVCKKLIKGETELIDNNLATYMGNIYGYKDLYGKEVSIHYKITLDLNVYILCIEENEICTSNKIKYFQGSFGVKDTLVFCVRKDFNEMEDREKVLTIVRIVNTTLRTIYDTDMVNSTLSVLNFYAQIVIAYLVLRDIVTKNTIVDTITEKYKEQEEVVKDVNTICEYVYNALRQHLPSEESIINNLLHLGGVVTVIADSREEE